VKPPSVAEDEDESHLVLGALMDIYLQSHGYTIIAIHEIEHANNFCKTSHSFINYLNSCRMPWREAEFVWVLLQGDDSL